MQTAIAIIAALRREVAPLLKSLTERKMIRIGGMRFWTGELSGIPVCILCSGMGDKYAKAAATALLGHCRPKAIISAGFGGALNRGLSVADLVIGREIFAWENGTVRPVMSTLLSFQVNAGLQSILREGVIVTSRSLTKKQMIQQSLPLQAENPVIDLETATIAQTARDHRIPLVAIRSISDSSDEEIGFTLDQICDESSTVKLLRVLPFLLRKPSLIPQFWRLAKQSRQAARTLADGLCLLLPAVEGALHRPSAAIE